MSQPSDSPTLFTQLNNNLQTAENLIKNLGKLFNLELQLAQRSLIKIMLFAIIIGAMMVAVIFIVALIIIHVIYQLTQNWTFAFSGIMAIYIGMSLLLIYKIKQNIKYLKFRYFRKHLFGANEEE